LGYYKSNLSKMKILKILASFAVVALLLSGCGEKSSSPMLKVQHVNSISLPPDGLKIPAPRSVTIGQGNEIVILDDCAFVTVATNDGKIIRRWKMPDFAIGRPEGVNVMNDGKIVVSDTHYSRVVAFEPDGKISFTFGTKGQGEGQFGNPVGVTHDDKENLYVSEYGEMNRVQKFTKDGKFILAFGGNGNGPGKFERASGITWHDGKVYVTDAVNNRIQVFDEQGKYLKSFGGKESGFTFYLPYDLYFHGEDLYVVEYGSSRISKINADGKLEGCFGSPGRDKGNFTTPWGIAVDNQGCIYVADTGNRRIAVLK